MVELITLEDLKETAQSALGSARHSKLSVSESRYKKSPRTSEICV